MKNEGVAHQRVRTLALSHVGRPGDWRRRRLRHLRRRLRHLQCPCGLGRDLDQSCRRMRWQTPQQISVPRRRLGENISSACCLGSDTCHASRDGGDTCHADRDANRDGGGTCHADRMQTEMVGAPATNRGGTRSCWWTGGWHSDHTCVRSGVGVAVVVVAVVGRAVAVAVASAA